MPPGRHKKNPDKPAPKQRIHYPKPVGRPPKDPEPAQIPVQEKTRPKNERSPEVIAEMARLDQEQADRIKKSEGLPGKGMFVDQKDQDLEEWRAKRAEQKKKDREKAERWLDETLGG